MNPAPDAMLIARFYCINLSESSNLLSFSDSGRIPIYHSSRPFSWSLLPHSTTTSTGNFNFVEMTSTQLPPRPLELLDLPTEIHMAIAAYFSVPDILNLKNTTRYLNALMPPLTHSELLDAEDTLFSSFAWGKDILSTPDYYACKTVFVCAQNLNLRTI